MARRRAPEPHGLRYVETSALLAALLEGDLPAKRAMRGPDTLVTSSLTFAEARRAIVRARRSERLSADQERAAIAAVARFRRRCAVMPITEEILARTGKPFPVEPIRTLDAIHLSTAAALTDDPQSLTIITRDERIRSNAATMGHPLE